MSVLVTILSDADHINGNQIAAFDLADRQTGVGNVDVDGRCGLAVWDVGTVPNGVYIVRMKSNNFIAVRKALLVK